MSRKNPNVNDVIRVGRVSAVYPERHTATVNFPDRGSGLITKELPIRVSLSRKNHFYAMPDEGEHVICAFYGNGLSEGVILGALYDSGNSPPIPNRDIYSIVFEDKTQITFNRKEHILEILDSFGSAIRMEDGYIYLAPAKKVRVIKGGK